MCISDELLIGVELKCDELHNEDGNRAFDFDQQLCRPLSCKAKLYSTTSSHVNATTSPTPTQTTVIYHYTDIDSSTVPRQWKLTEQLYICCVNGSHISASPCSYARTRRPKKFLSATSDSRHFQDWLLLHALLGPDEPRPAVNDPGGSNGDQSSAIPDLLTICSLQHKSAWRNCDP